MAGCLDNARCPEWCDRFEDKRNDIASIVAGSLFFSGWWLLIGACAVYSQTDLPRETIICGVCATIALIMVNSVSTSQIRGESMNEGCMGTKGARVWLFIGFLFAFGSLIAAGWILFGLSVTQNVIPVDPGLSIFFQNVLIFFSTIVFKFGRSEEDI